MEPMEATWHDGKVQKRERSYPVVVQKASPDICGEVTRTSRFKRLSGPALCL